MATSRQEQALQQLRQNPQRAADQLRHLLSHHGPGKGKQRNGKVSSCPETQVPNSSFSGISSRRPHSEKPMHQNQGGVAKVTRPTSARTGAGASRDPSAHEKHELSLLGL